jgi:putative acetyltransferase
LQRGCRVLRLETGPYQPDAIGLYERCGFARRGPFGAYADDPLSVFMEKTLAGVQPHPLFDGDAPA